MRFDEALVEILKEVEQIGFDVPNAVWYAFGSYFKGQNAFSDIDILITCPTTADAILIRTKTEDICARWPLHLVIMTDDEQKETGFIESEGCVLLLRRR
jgi:uncharacterized protein (DUF302 family)